MGSVQGVAVSVTKTWSQEHIVFGMTSVKLQLGVIDRRDLYNPIKHS